MTISEQVSTLRRRLIAVTAWDAAFRTMTGWIFLFGVSVLLCRILRIPLSNIVWPGFAVLGLAIATAILFSLRRKPASEAVAALMDARLVQGGLVMASEAGMADDWPEQANPIDKLVVRWNGHRPSIILLAAISFLAMASFVPLAEGMFQEDRPMEIGSTVDQLEKRVELLQAIGLVEEQQAKEWSTVMQALRQESSGTDPAATWEALDQLQKRVEDAVAAEVASRRMEVQKREELVAALKAALQAYDENRETADAAMKELSGLLQQAAKKNPNLKALLDSLPEFGRQQLVAGALDKETARMLAERLSKMTKEDLERMQQLLQQGLCQSSDCMRPGDMKSLKRFLEEHPGCTNLVACAGMAPGGWGVNRGPGTAPISWLNETSEEGVDFKEKVLASSRVDSLTNSEKVGESASAPDVDAQAAGSAGGVLQGVKADDSAASAYTVLPRHRNAVNRFFKREEGK